VFRGFGLHAKRYREKQAVKVSFNRNENRQVTMHKSSGDCAHRGAALMIVIVAIAAIGCLCASVSWILNNVTVASDFNQDFKRDGRLEDVLLCDR
jgi:hypothetical protein